MITRKELLDGGATHDEYYGQFVDDGVKKRVLSHISAQELLSSNDPHFNDISLQRWDRIGMTSATAKKLRAAGDYLTLAGSVCIAKAAARLISKRV